MAQAISFERFLRHVISGCQKLDDWLNEPDGIAAEYRDKYEYHVDKLKLWMQIVNTAATMAQNGEMSTTECLTVLIKQGRRVILDPRMPQYMATTLNRAMTKILSDIEPMWAYCDISSLALGAAKIIREMADCLKDKIDGGEIKDEQLLFHCTQFMGYLNKRYKAAMMIKGHDDYHKISQELKRFGELGASERKARMYLDKIQPHDYTLYRFLADRPWRIRQWYTFALNAAKLQAEIPDDNDKLDIRIVDANVVAAKNLQDSFNALEAMLTDMKEITVPLEVIYYRKEFIREITIILSLMRLVLNADFAFTEDREILSLLVIWVTSINLGHYDIGGSINEIYGMRGFDSPVCENFHHLLTQAKDALLNADRIVKALG